MKGKFYWIKLRTDFFEMPTIDWLMEQENGCKYVVLYQKLCLLAANTGGELVRKIGQMMIPYDEKKIAELTKFDFDTVVIGLGLYKKCGLIVEEDLGIFKITNFDDVVGSETKWAQYKRKGKDSIPVREKIGLENFQSNSNQTPMSIETLENFQSQSKESPKVQKNMDFMAETLENFQSKSNLSPIRERYRDLDKDTDTEIDTEKENPFDTFWESYPKKYQKNKEDTKTIFEFMVEYGIDPLDLIYAAKKYCHEVKSKGVESRYIKMPDNFLSDAKYLEYVPLIKQDCPLCKGQGYIIQMEDDGRIQTFLCSCRERYKKFKKNK